MRALRYISPFPVEGHKRGEAIGICGEEYPMGLPSEFSSSSFLVSQLFVCPPASTSISIRKITVWPDPPCPRHLQSKEGGGGCYAHCSMISSGRPSNGGGVSRTRGAFSMLDRRASAGAEASSMALLRYRWAVSDAAWHVRNGHKNSLCR